MAQIIYYLSPLDETKTKVITSKGTLGYALKEFGIENDPLSVTINGITPDELSLDTVLDDTDFVEVRRLVHGGGRSKDKSTLATIVQLTALVAATFLTAGAPLLAAGIMVAGQVAAGALNKWAADLAASEVATNKDEIDIESNNFSLHSANNEARPLSPMPIPMGSHRFAPDVITPPLVDMLGSTFSSGAVSPFQSNFKPSQAEWVGPDSPDNSWVLVTKNSLTSDFPPYDIKVSSYGIVNKATALTTEEAQLVRDRVQSRRIDGTAMKTNENYSLSNRQAHPIIIFHCDSTDPFRGRYNYLYTLVKWHASFRYAHGLAYQPFMNALFNGTFVSADSTLRSLFFASATGSGGINNTHVRPSAATTYLPPNASIGTAAALTAWGNEMLKINGGSYPTTGALSYESYNSSRYVFDVPVSMTKIGIPYSRQKFSFGLGDMDILDCRIGDVKVAQGNQFGYSPMVSSMGYVNTFYDEKYNIVSIGKWEGIGYAQYPFYNDLITHQSKKLINQSNNGDLVSGLSNEDNFIYFSGQPYQYYVQFNVRGRLYNATSSGISANTCRIQFQMKRSDETVWVDTEVNPIITVSNSNANEICIPYSFITPPVTIGTVDTTYLQIRVRKVTKDSDNAEGTKVCELSIADIVFYEDYSDRNILNLPMTQVGLWLTALTNDSAVTNKFSALVEAKCWVYNFSTEKWRWEHTRNPAFWFLFFARGGFYNPTYDKKTYPVANPVFPFSPTVGWVNAPNIEGNEGHMFGGGYTENRIDMDKILEWAYFCEDRGLTLDYIIRDEDTVQGALEKIANTGRGSVTYYGGKVSVVYEDEQQVPVCLFGMGNIIAGTFSVDYATGEQYRKVVANFTNRETWESEQVEALVPFSDPENVKVITLTMVGVTDKALAQREVNILAARQFFQKRTYTFTVDFEGYLARRGDLAYLAHDSTQYGYSGRVMDFIVEAGVVVGIKVGVEVDRDASYITIRNPLNEIETYECHVENGVIVFDEPYDIEEAPYYVNGVDENTDSRFNKSIPEDFIFIADVKETTGKRVRISSIEVSEDNQFTITAVDEDPAMWSYEFNDVIPPESFNDSTEVLEVYDVKAIDMGGGKVKILWNSNSEDFVTIQNLNNGLPIEANGQYSFSGGEVVIELVSGIQFELEVRPYVIGTPYRVTPKRVKVWPK